jgi:hypothetical protein
MVSMAQGKDSEGADTKPKKRATVASVDKKIDDVIEVMDIVHSDIMDLKRVLKGFLELLGDDKKSKGPDNEPPKDPYGNSMYG